MTLFIGTLLIFVRTAAMLLVAPVLGNRSVPVYVKVSLSIMIAIAVAPLVLERSGMSINLVELQLSSLISTLTNELIIGTLLGIGILIIFSAAMMIGSVVGQMSGLPLDFLAPTDQFGQRPTTQLIAISAAAVFVLVNGPELLVTSVLDSFVAVPPGETVSSANVLSTLTTLLQQSFELTVRAVAPAVATLLVSTVLVGALCRVVPQLNLIQVGLASNQALMITAVFLTLGGCIWLAVDELPHASERINESLSAAKLDSN